MPLAETVAVVTGASRGLGRGTARALGSSAMVVYLTGRSGGPLYEAAAEVNKAGGTGIAVICDHGDDAQVQALFARIRAERGRLDLLVNNAAAVHHEELGRPGPFWQKALNLADMITIGLRSDYVTAYYAAPLMIETGTSLIVNISFYGAVSYFVGPAYGAAKAGTDKMVHDMGVDFKDTDVSIVSLWPGYVRTDEMKAIPDEMFPEGFRQILPEFETPEFTGLVIAALLKDPECKAFSGRTLIGAELGHRYGIKDIDGKQPRDWTAVMGEPASYFTAE